MSAGGRIVVWQHVFHKGFSVVHSEGDSIRQPRHYAYKAYRLGTVQHHMELAGEGNGGILRVIGVGAITTTKRILKVEPHIIIKTDTQ